MRDKKMTKLKDIIKVRLNEPTSKTDDYMRGLSNGLLLAEAILEDKDPVYINKEN